MRRLWWRLFGHPLRGRVLVVNGKKIGVIQSIRGRTITFDTFVDTGTRPKEEYDGKR